MTRRKPVSVALLTLLTAFGSATPANPTVRRIIFLIHDDGQMAVDAGEIDPAILAGHGRRS